MIIHGTLTNAIRTDQFSWYLGSPSKLSIDTKKMITLLASKAFFQKLLGRRNLSSDFLLAESGWLVFFTIH